MREAELALDVALDSDGAPDASFATSDLDAAFALDFGGPLGSVGIGHRAFDRERRNQDELDRHGMTALPGEGTELPERGAERLFPSEGSQSDASIRTGERGLREAPFLDGLEAASRTAVAVEVAHGRSLDRISAGIGHMDSDLAASSENKIDVSLLFREELAQWYETGCANDDESPERTR
jgi:hypothetical protein